MRADRVERDAVALGKAGGKRTQSADKFVGQRESPEVVGRCIAHRGNREANGERVATSRVSGIGPIWLQTDLTHVLAQIVRLVDDDLPWTRNNEMIGRVDRFVVSTRPMQRNRAKIAIGKRVGAIVAKESRRMEHQKTQPEIAEGEYLAPTAPAPAPGGAWKKAGGAAVGIGLLFAKFKFLLLGLLNIKWIFLILKFGLSFGSIFVSILAYAVFFGWKLGVVFVLLMLMHEIGHIVAMRAYGLRASLPYFIPGFGAFVTQQSASPGRLADAVIALGGPIIGSLAAGVCYIYGAATNEPFWIAAAHLGLLLNLFQLIPVLPLDGGRAAGAISPRFFLFGLVLLATYVVATRSFQPIMLLLLLVVAMTSIPRAIRAWKGQPDPDTRPIGPAERGTIMLLYFGAIGLIGIAAVASNIHVG